MNDTSLSLLDRIREKSDSESWNRLISLYAPLLRRWLRRYEVQEPDADDIVQDVLTAVLKNLPRFQHNRRAGAFRNWLRTILLNRVRLYWRSRKYRPIASGTSSVDEVLNQLQDDVSELSQIWNREHDEYVIKHLLEAIQPRFEPRTWQAFHRQVVEGQKADAVSRDLEMPLSSVYMAKSRVLAALRRESAELVDEV